jgi:hypothetical protein
VSAYSDNPNVVGNYVTFKCDDTTNRRSRAAQITAAVRKYERAHKVCLIHISSSYSETHGFLSQSALRYRIKFRNCINV